MTLPGKISDCMKRNVVSIPFSASIGDAAASFARHHISTLPAVAEDGYLVGLLQIRDLLALVMPDFVRLVEHFDYVGDFGAVETRKPGQKMLTRPIKDVLKPPVSVDENCGLLRAFAVLNKQNLYDLPVVNMQDKLIGIASRVDIATALFHSWVIPSEGSQ